MSAPHDRATCRLCRPRTRFDAHAGIRCDRGGDWFFVHCGRCGEDYGPFASLAEAEGERLCPACWAGLLAWRKTEIGGAS